MKFWHSKVVKTLALEEIYADPHKLDRFIDSGEPVAVISGGRAVAEFVPQRTETAPGAVTKPPQIDYRARFLEMWGPGAFESTVSVEEEFDELRRMRDL